MGQELTHGWSLIPVMAEALERAGSRNREAIREAALKMDIHDVHGNEVASKTGHCFRSKRSYSEEIPGCPACSVAGWCSQRPFSRLSLPSRSPSGLRNKNVSDSVSYCRRDLAAEDMLQRYPP